MYRIYYSISLIIIFNFINFLAIAQNKENAAPSIHLNYSFHPNDAILKMQKIKIVASAHTSFFEVNGFKNGYTGLQHTPDTKYQVPNTFIFSLWDLNTAKGIHATVEYKAPNTIYSRFGGEGDGAKTMNPYNWKLNTWYNIVNRSWKKDGKLYIATFIQNLNTQHWFHTATLSIPDTSTFLESYNDAFLENWDGTNPEHDGRFERKAFFKDIWNLTPSGKWQKPEKIEFSANESEHDRKRNGKYHNSFNAYFDTKENAYCMQHGGQVKPSLDFKGSRKLVLPLSNTHLETPRLTIPEVNSFQVTYDKSIITLNWVINERKSPQLGGNIKIIDADGKTIHTYTFTKPEKRETHIKSKLQPGQYTIVFYMKDIFNQTANEVKQTLIIK